MKIFGTLFPFVESSEESLKLGRFVANYEFLVALLNYGTFDKYHIYCMSPAHFQSTLTKLSNDNSINDNSRIKVELFLYDQLEENLGKIAYHVFHLGGWGYFWGGTVALRNRCAVEPFPVTSVIHSLNSNDTISELYKLVESPAAPYDRVICTSNAGKEVISKGIALTNKEFNGKLCKIPLGYNDKIINSTISKSEARNRLNLAQDSTVLLYLGRLSPSTKADLYPLLQVVQSLITRTDKNITLILAGGVKGSELRLHKDMINELGLDTNVKLMINFENELKPIIYRAADIYVAPSDNIQETFGISVVEAMASGLPIVASDIDGYKELVVQGETGVKIPTIWSDSDNLESIYEIMDSGVLQLTLAQKMVVVPKILEDILLLLIDDSSLRETFGTNGKKRAEELYRWEVVINEYEMLWDKLKVEALSTNFSGNDSTLFDPKFLHLFSHYPTATLQDNMIVKIRPRGEKLLADTIFPSIYSDMAMVLDQDVILSTLAELRSSAKLVKELSSFNHTKFRSTLLWMAKYDLLELMNE